MKDKHTRTEIGEALHAINHPQQRHNALETAYDGAIERINNQTSNKRIWARRLLAWVFHARRLLTPKELIHALSVRIGDHGLNEENFVSLPEVVSLCAGLVMIDEKSTVVRLVHYTTKEYLTHRSSTAVTVFWIGFDLKKKSWPGHVSPIWHSIPSKVAKPGNTKAIATTLCNPSQSGVSSNTPPDTGVSTPASSRRQ